MANPFYVDPSMNLMPGLSSVSGALSRIGQKNERQRLIDEKKEVREEMAAIQQGAVEAFQSGDPDKIAEFSLMHPEFSKTLTDQANFRNERTKDNYFVSAIQAIDDPSKLPELAEKRKAILASEGLGEDGMQETMSITDQYQQDPKGTIKMLEKEVAAMMPDRWKQYRDATKVEGNGAGASKKQKTGAFLIKQPDGSSAIVTGVFDPATGSLRTESATIGGGQLISSLGETAQEQTTRQVEQKRGEVAATNEEKRDFELIDKGVVAAESTATLRRTIDLLETVKTGGIDKVRVDAKRIFGIESADEGELVGSLGKAVLSQLRDTFGAAFTQEEGARLERIEANIGKSPAANKRLLQQALSIAERNANRARKVAMKRGDEDVVNDIDELLKFNLGESLEPSANVPASEMSDEELFKTAMGQ